MSNKYYYNYYNYLSDDKLGLNNRVIETYKSEQKYIIYKGSGGLVHNLKGLSFAIEIAIKQKRILIIDMNRHSAFGTFFSTFFTINFPELVYFDNYTQVPPYLHYFKTPLVDIKNNPASYKKDGYYLKNHNISGTNMPENQQLIIYAGAVIKYNESMFKIKINSYYYKKLLDEPHIKSRYISVHFRNTDKSNNIYDYILKIQQIINQTGISNLYLATDDYKAYDIFKQNLGDVVIYRKTIPKKVKKNLHYEELDKLKLHYDLICDIYFILKSNYFLPSVNSGISLYIIEMLKRKQYLIPNITSNTIVLKLDISK